MTDLPPELAASVARSEVAARRAPEPLALVQALVNTLNRLRGYDLLDDRETARWWFSSVAPELDAEGVGTAEVASLRRLREALRALLRSQTGGVPMSPADRAALEDAAARRPLTIGFDDRGTPGVRAADVAAADPGAALEARVLATLPAAASDGTLMRLKACANPECEWAFYDTSRSRSGNWCVMNLCGARSKMSRYRDRNRNDSTSSQGPPR
jgi:predicted RNA-binding Zn ribbon-like protein